MTGAESRKPIPESLFAADDGSIDPILAQALIQYQARKTTLADFINSLARCRVLVPVLATGDLRHLGEHGLMQDAIASTAVVAVELPDGRRALPVFTDVGAMQIWKPEARPIPAELPRAAAAAIMEDWAAIVLNPQAEAILVPRPAVWALAQGIQWVPAVSATEVDPILQADVLSALNLPAPVVGIELIPGKQAEVALVVTLTPGLTEPEVRAVVGDLSKQLAGLEEVVQRIDSLEIKLRSAAS